ncbi:MAG TPA: hypothetical protein EYN96_00785 [Candidatus Hydrogenedentes bacterium]|nr:hypothetical protein [Candidatus Hydrogenedentota bacterium]
MRNEVRLNYVIISLLLIAMNASTHADFHVAINGDDKNPGTQSAPFATIQHAQTTVRQQITDRLNSDLTVWIHQGNYELEAPLHFTPQDSGTREHSIAYVGVPNESVTLSGGEEVSNWTRIGNNQWVTTLAEVANGTWTFRQLFADGKRLPRGRYPNAPEILRVKSVSEDVKTIAITTPDPIPDLANQNAELVMYQNWSISRVGIVSSTEYSVLVANPMGWIGHGPATTASPGKPTYLEHALAFVDVPGEWYLDYKTGLLTYQAAPDEDPNARTFIAPRSEQLIIIEGTKNSPVRNLHFKNVTFSHTSWHRPQFGYLGIQAGHHGTAVPEPTHVLPAAIEFTYARDCSIRSCKILHTGAGGIVLGVGCRQNTIGACELTDIGANAVMVGWRTKGSVTGEVRGEDFHLSGDWTDPEDAPTENEIIGNTIERPGAINHGCVAVFDAFARATRIAHNVIHDTPYTGISVGFRWNESETSQRDTTIEYNHVYDTMKMLTDGGCLYTLGYQPGTIIRGNTFHDAHRSEFAHGGAPNNGIFFDQSSKGFHVEGNTIYNTSGNPIRFNQTKPDNMTWKDNAFGTGIAYKDKP